MLADLGVPLQEDFPDCFKLFVVGVQVWHEMNEVIGNAFVENPTLDSYLSEKESSTPASKGLASRRWPAVTPDGSASETIHYSPDDSSFRSVFCTYSNAGKLLESTNYDAQGASLGTTS